MTKAKPESRRWDVRVFATKVQFMSNSGLRTKSQLFLLSLFVCLLCGCETREGRQVTGCTADILRNFPRPQHGDSFKAVADSTGRRRTDLKAAGLHGKNFSLTSTELHLRGCRFGVGVHVSVGVGEEVSL